jgi:hypothetical protein
LEFCSLHLKSFHIQESSNQKFPFLLQIANHLCFLSFFSIQKSSYRLETKNEKNQDHLPLQNKKCQDLEMIKSNWRAFSFSQSSMIFVKLAENFLELQRHRPTNSIKELKMMSSYFRVKSRTIESSLLKNGNKY